jgi:hypothetical protein
MVTAKEYRELALEFYRWAEQAEADEVRDTYTRLADAWTIAALSVNCSPPTTSGHTITTITRH